MSQGSDPGPYQGDDDEIDGCEVDLTEDPTPDEDIDGIVLFADVDPNDAEAIQARQQGLNVLFGGSDA